MSKLVQLNVTGTTNGMDGKFSFAKDQFLGLTLPSDKNQVGLTLSYLDNTTHFVFETKALTQEFYNEVIRQMEED